MLENILFEKKYNDSQTDQKNQWIARKRKKLRAEAFSLKSSTVTLNQVFDFVENYSQLSLIKLI